MDAKARWLWQTLAVKLTRNELLNEALTHRSVSGGGHNERLEFLGDAVLSLVIADALYAADQLLNEGEMSRARSALVNAETLTELARSLDLSEQIEVGLGEVRNGAFSRTGVLADAFEAVLGAIYLDQGLEVTRQVIHKLYVERIDYVLKHLPEKDPKSALQEWCQANGLALPVYEQTKIIDDGHQKHFTVRVNVIGLEGSAEGEGTSLKRAERVAAKQLLLRLTEKAA